MRDSEAVHVSTENEKADLPVAGFMKTVLAVVWKDLVAELRSRELLSAMLVFALLFMAVLGFLIYGFARLLQVTPRYTGKAQDFFALLSAWARTIADGAAKPFVWFQQAGAILKAIFKL